jgi:deoxyribodipyrimidine photo-lyase
LTAFVNHRMQPVVVFWFRRDLRLHDNAGLYAALSSGLPVVPLFIFDKDILDHLQDKNDKRVSFIYTALQNMQATLVKKGSTMDVRYGRPETVFKQALSGYAVQAVYTNHDYEPYARSRDESIAKMLSKQSISFYTFKDHVLFEKAEVAKPDDSGYAMYAPYAKRWRLQLQEAGHQVFPSERLDRGFYQQAELPFPSLGHMGFVYNPDIPKVQEAETAVIKQYHQARNTPSVNGTTRMGVHLRFGTVSIRNLVAKAVSLNEKFVNELIWREFFMQLLWHQPRLEREACKKEYDLIKWRNNETEFEQWCKGKTGFPIVDAGMRELNESGFMHNRVRMIAASFLVKDLLIDWRWGEAYFARKLLDFELASNNGNWQWVAGCGCDAAPYFRVFNPETQAKKFDPQLLYIRKWVPEFDTLHYSQPMVDHTVAKERCVKAYKAALQKKNSFA